MPPTETSAVRLVSVDRVPADIEAERFLFERQFLLRQPIVDMGRPALFGAIRFRVLRRRRPAEQREQRRLPRVAVALDLRRALHRPVDVREQPRAIRPHVVERARLDERLQYFFIAAPRIDALAELVE
jgi:hypothetical protein